MNKLSKRMQAVAALVQNTTCLADVGCDHGYVPIYLIQSECIGHAIAMDVNRGPLLRAEEHIREVHLEDYIETRLSDGLTALAPSEADGVVIAGMGGALMKRILAEHPEVWKKMNNLVLQPQSEIEEVRRYIYAEGFHIEEEDMVEEEGKYYVMLRCVPGKAAPLTDVAFRYGGYLLQTKNEILKQYLIKQRQQFSEILKKLEIQKLMPEQTVLQKPELLRQSATQQDELQQKEDGSTRRFERQKELEEKLAMIEEAERIMGENI